MEIELLISDAAGEKAYIPAVEEGIEWTTERRSAPGKLTFSIVKDELIDFQEGAAVRMKVDSEPVFFGFVFTKKTGQGSDHRGNGIRPASVSQQ